MIQVQRLLLLAMLFVWFVVPLLAHTWQSAHLPWYSPFIAWALLIFGTFVREAKRNNA